MLAARDVSPGVRLATLGPNPSTPNGDGVNDVTRFQVQALAFLGRSELHFRLHTLSGHAVRTIRRGLGCSGDTGLNWDGLDDEGRRCTTGLYVYRISVRTPQRELTSTATGTIAIAY